MPSTRIYNRSFGGGEMSPEMFGRIDDTKFQTGAATMRNFIALPQGPAENRPGFQFVREVKDSSKKTRLIPFTFSVTQTVVIEVGAGYFRFHTNGATILSGGVPYEVANPYAEAELFDIHYVQSADVMTLVHPNHAPRELRRLGATNWVLSTINFAPVVPPPTGLTVTPSFGFTLNITAITKANPGVITTASNHGLIAGDSVYVSSVGGMTQLVDDFYVVNTPTSPGGSTLSLKSYTTGTPINTSTFGTYTSGGKIQNAAKTADVENTYVVTAIAENGLDESVTSIAAVAINNLNITGAYNVIRWNPVTGAVRYNVYKKQSGLYGFIGQTEALEFTDNNIAPDLGTTPPIYDPSFAVDAIVSVPVTSGGTNYETTFTGGSITSVNVVAGGTGYNTPTLTVTDPTGSGATFTVNVNPSAPNDITSVTVNNAGSGYSAPIFVLTDTGTFGNPAGSGAVIAPVVSPIVYDAVTIGITDSTGSGAVIVPEITGGVITALKVVDGGSNYTAPTITITAAAGGSGATFGTPVLSGTNYPGAVSYFEQRRVFAGTIDSPQTLWMTRSGTESDLSYSLPVKDTDRIQFRVAAREANTIRHVVPLTQLLLLTSAAEWRVSPVNSDAITPTTISVRPQSYIGSNNVQPSIINNSLVYCSARGGHVRELGYSWQANGFVTGDLSIRAAHLFDDYDITDMCFAKAPQPLLWFVSTSGLLLGLTYIPEQQIGAWHKHDTDGAFESCTTVAEGAEDSLYVVVRRTIGGQTKRYVERMASRAFVDVQDAFFVDSGATYDGTNTGSTTVTVTNGSTWGPADTLRVTSSTGIFSFVAPPGVSPDVNDEVVVTDTDGQKYRLKVLTVISTTQADVRVDRTLPASLRGVAKVDWAWARDSIGGLGHLEGKTVSILAEGAVMSPKVVTGGTVALDRPAYVAHIGLPYVCDLQTLPVTINIDAFGQGRVTNVNHANVRVFRSSGLFVGPTEDRLVEAKMRTTEPYGTPPRLRTDDIEVYLTPQWKDGGQVFIRQSDPLPLTVVALTLEVAIGG